MYYKPGNEIRKIFNVDGFDFQLRVKKRAYSVEIVVLDHEGNSIDGLLVSEHERLKEEIKNCI
ncbi:phage protein [Staphylococcus aureus HOAG6043]|nr:phage protein [Staphylococcus aureus HOAG6043]